MLQQLVEDAKAMEAEAVRAENSASAGRRLGLDLIGNLKITNT